MIEANENLQCLNCFIGTFHANVDCTLLLQASIGHINYILPILLKLLLASVIIDQVKCWSIAPFRDIKCPLEGHE